MDVVFCTPQRNKKWPMVPHPHGRNIVGCCSVYTLKDDPMAQLRGITARGPLVAHGSRPLVAHGSIKEHEHDYQ